MQIIMKNIFRFLGIVCLVIVYSSCKRTKENKKHFSVIAYNVCDGLDSNAIRINTLVQWVKKQNPDVIAFEELNGFKQNSLEKLAKTWGHPYAVIEKESGYPVGITSRYPITHVYKMVKGMFHGCLFVETHGISFFVVHFSPFSSAKRLQEADSIIHYLKKERRLKTRTIVLGDFNSFSPFDSTFYTTTGIRDSMYAQQQRNKILRNLNAENQLDYQVMRSFMNQGLFDSYYLFHKNFEVSCPTKMYPNVPKSDLTCIDHILLSEDLKSQCQNVTLIKNAVTDTLSDHYPIRAIFNLK